MTIRRVTLGADVLEGNTEVAAANRRRLVDAGVLALNVMASPGAGKTSLILRTMEAVGSPERVGVIEGDVAGDIDARKVLAAGAGGVVQVNTGGGCHLDAGMVRRALDQLDLGALDLLFVENVGNLICPTHWSLGEDRRLCLLSAAEGHDKPVKYPDIFAAADVIVLNKLDLAPLVDFDGDAFHESVRALNRMAPVFEVSCRTGTGIEAWAEWVLARMAEARPATAS